MKEETHLKEEMDSMWVQYESQQRVWILMTMWYFSFSFFITFAKMYTFLFFSVKMGVLSTLMRNKINLILANGCNETKGEQFKGVWILSVPTVYRDYLIPVHFQGYSYLYAINEGVLFDAGGDAQCEEGGHTVHIRPRHGAAVAHKRHTERDERGTNKEKWWNNSLTTVIWWTSCSCCYSLGVICSERETDTHFIQVESAVVFFILLDFQICSSWVYLKQNNDIPCMKHAAISFFLHLFR